MGMSPSNQAQQRITVPSHIENRPHLVVRVRCSQQKLVRLPLARLTQIEHRERWQRRSLTNLDATTTRHTCTTDVTTHKVLPFASDQHFPRRGSDAGDGLPVCAGGLLFLARSCRAQVVGIHAVYLSLQCLIERFRSENLQFFRPFRCVVRRGHGSRPEKPRSRWPAFSLEGRPATTRHQTSTAGECCRHRPFDSWCDRAGSTDPDRWQNRAVGVGAACFGGLAGVWNWGHADRGRERNMRRHGGEVAGSAHRACHHEGRAWPVGRTHRAIHHPDRKGRSVGRRGRRGHRPSARRITRLAGLRHRPARLPSRHVAGDPPCSHPPRSIDTSLASSACTCAGCQMPPSFGRMPSVTRRIPISRSCMPSARSSTARRAAASRSPREAPRSNSETCAGCQMPPRSGVSRSLRRRWPIWLRLSPWARSSIARRVAASRS